MSIKKTKDIDYPTIDPVLNNNAQSSERQNPTYAYKTQGRINIQYIYSSSGNTSLFAADSAGYGLVGFWDAGGTIVTPAVNCPVYVPANIEIIEANIYLYSSPVYYQNGIGGSYGYTQVKEAKLYKDPTSVVYVQPYASEGYYNWSGGTDIHNTIFGAETWEPTANSSVQTTNASIMGQLVAGSVTNLYVKTSSTYAGGSNDETNNHSTLKIDIVVKGYIFK